MRYNDRTGEWEGADVERQQASVPSRRTSTGSAASRQSVGRSSSRQSGNGTPPPPFRNASADVDWNRVREIALELDERAAQRDRERIAAMNRYFDRLEADDRESYEHPVRWFLKKLFRH